MDRAGFEAITRAAGIEPTSSNVRFIGDGDPIYPSPLRLAAGTATILGNIAGAIDEIRYQQTGQRQSAEINLGQAVVGISSLWVLKIDGELAYQPPGDGFPPGDGIFPTRDGRHLYLLSSFPHLIERTLDVLGCTVDTLADHVAAHAAAELEHRLVDAQLSGVMVRAPEEWRAHPQGKLLAGSPAVIIEKIGETPPIPVPGGALPLNGVRVLDNTRILAGPVNGRTLAALGAEVLHVGSPNVPDGVSSQADTGHGKRRAYIDLETSQGREAIWNLIDGADIFSQSYRARSLDRRGLSPEALAERRPGIIYVSENAFGQFGPWREKRGYDHTVQAASGLHHITHDHPTRQFVRGLPSAFNDYGTGYWGAYGALEALRRRAVEGGSWHVKVALGQTAAWFLRLGAPHRKSDADPDEAYRLAERYSEEVDSDYGTLTRLRFPIQFSDMVPRWSRTVKPGTHEPVWL